jgi:zinc protease
MKYTTFTDKGYHGGAITRIDEKTVHCRISVDLHTSHSVQQSATEQIYTDALLSGAGTYDRAEFIDAVSMLGASVGVSIHNSRLTVTLRSIEENAPKLLKLFVTMMTSPSFTATELKRIQTQTVLELIEHTEDAKAIAQENFENTLYGTTDRRYTHTPVQITAATKKVTTDNLKQLHTTAMQGMWTVTVGASTKSVAHVQSAIKICKKGIALSAQKRSHIQKAPTKKTLLQDIPSKQNIEFAIGTSVPLTLHHPDYLPLVFGLNVLGKWGGFTGRLMSRVREKEGLTYGIYAKTESVEDEEQGHYRIMTFFSPDTAIQGLTSTLREISKIHAKGITQGEYERFQTILATQQTLLADSLTRSVDTLHGYLCADFSLIEMDEYKNRLMTVTRKEINHALKTYLHPDKLTISGAGPTQKIKKDILAIQ